MLMMQKSGLLPAGYMQVEYVQSSGYSYIALPFAIAANETVEAQAKIQNMTTLTNNVWFVGDGSSNDASQFEIGFYGGGVYRPNGATVSTSWASTDGWFAPFEVTLTRKYTKTVNLTWRLFGRHGYGTGANGAFNCRIWYMRLFKDGTLYHNLVPCYRKSDNAIGMYDTVTKTFFTNMNSVGEFIIPE